MEDTPTLTEVSLLILLALYQPRHGYAVMQFIEQQTAGRVKLGAGSLYGAINNLADKAWIELLSDEHARRKEYQITPQGRVVVQGEIERLHRLIGLARQITEEE